MAAPLATSKGRRQNGPRDEENGSFFGLKVRESSSLTVS